ncbi:hypothetical protein QJQ45_030109 [Haematococcus lacustris]|nr:hypothetical protein QJQ45_030109 [Haematococcus lacustris]
MSGINAQTARQHFEERYQHQPTVYQPSLAPFEGYAGHQCTPRMTLTPGSSTYSSAFVPHAAGQRAAPTPRTGQLPTSAPFEGTTSYRCVAPGLAAPAKQGLPHGPTQGDYVGHSLEPRPQRSPTAGHQPLPFTGSTTYGEQFKPYPIQAQSRGTSKPSDMQASGARFEGTSETMDKYRAWAMDPTHRRGGPPPPMRPSLPFDGSTTHREMFKGWQLPPQRPALGVQMLGDKVYTLIPANAPIPALGRQIFTTVHDNQTEISVLVLEGDFTQASRCNVLGQFDLANLPPGPKGKAKVEVSFHVDAQGVLNVSATDMDTQRQEQWLRDGFLVARLG